MSLDWPATIWLIRHGQSAGNVARDAAEASGAALIDIAMRDADAPLSQLGEQQALALGNWFAALPPEERPQTILTSPFLRSALTAQAIADAVGLERERFRLDERLREKEFGILDRFTTHGIAEKFPELAAQRALVGKFYFRPPGGESWTDVLLRLRSVLDGLRRDEAGARIAIVSHQVVVNCFRYLLEGLDEPTILAIDRQADVPNCGITAYVSNGSLRTMRRTQTNLTLPLEHTGTPITVAKDQPAGPR
jgi:broad specificity phosphatase PhoE